MFDVDIKAGQTFGYRGNKFVALGAIDSTNNPCIGCAFDQSAHCFMISKSIDCTDHDVIFVKANI